MKSHDMIRNVEIEKGADGNITRVSCAFGPHYFVDVFVENGKPVLTLGATHHGFKADASEVMGELERFVNEIKERHPQNTF